MPQVTYIGPFDEVEIAATGQVVRQGGSVEVPDALAVSLLRQSDNWQASKKSTTSADTGEEG